MKLLSVFISFALVGHIFATNLDDYIQQVILVNDEIERARELMPAIIKKLVLSYRTIGTQETAYMLAVPDYIELELLGPGFDSDHDYTEDTFKVADTKQRQIPVINLDPEEGNLEVIDHNQDQIPVINLDPEEDINPDQTPVINLDPEEDTNLDPSTVPEEASTSENPNFVGIEIRHLKEKFKFQRMMRLAILFAKDRQEYNRIMESARKAQTDPTLIQSSKLPDRVPTYDKKENLATLLEKRRINPTEVSKRRVFCTYALDLLAEARRDMTLEAIKSLIRQNDPVFQDLFNMCRLAAAFRSIKYPESFIIAVDILDDDRCGLTDVTDENAYIYTFIGAEFWEVDLETDAPIKLFLSELE